METLCVINIFSLTSLCSAFTSHSVTPSFLETSANIVLKERTHWRVLSRDKRRRGSVCTVAGCRSMCSSVVHSSASFRQLPVLFCTSHVAWQWRCRWRPGAAFSAGQDSAGLTRPIVCPGSADPIVWPDPDRLALSGGQVSGSGHRPGGLSPGLSLARLRCQSPKGSWSTQ